MNINSKNRYEQVGGDDNITSAVIGRHSISIPNEGSLSSQRITKNLLCFAETLAQKLQQICNVTRIEATSNDIVNEKATATSTSSRFNFGNDNESRNGPLEEHKEPNVALIRHNSSEWKNKSSEEKNNDTNNSSTITIKQPTEHNKTSSNFATATKSTATSTKQLTTSKPLQQDKDVTGILQEHQLNLSSKQLSTNQTIVDQDYQAAIALQRSLPYDNNKYNEHNIAFQFVMEVIERHNRIRNSPKGSNLIENIAIDSLYDVTCKMIKCQQDFLNGNGYDTNTPVEVTLAYHYARKKHIKAIAGQGLHCSTRGTFGPGIYLGNNPCAFHSRAPIGLIVAVLKGKCERSESNRSSGAFPSSAGGTVSANTIIGNKHRRHIQPATKLSALSAPDNTFSYYDEIILKESRQCVPLIKFEKTLVNPNEENGSGNDTVWMYHQEMQKVVNEFFNSGIPLGDRTTKSDIFPSKSKSCSSLLSPASIPSSDGLYGGVRSFANGMTGQNNYTFRGNEKMANKVPVSDKQPNFF